MKIKRADHSTADSRVSSYRRSAMAKAAEAYPNLDENITREKLQRRKSIKQGKAPNAGRMLCTFFNREEIWTRPL